MESETYEVTIEETTLYVIPVEGCVSQQEAEDLAWQMHAESSDEEKSRYFYDSNTQII